MEKMKELSQQLYWIPERGVLVTLPPDLSGNISHQVINMQSLDIQSQVEIRTIASDPTLRKRYPQAEQGYQLMSVVDFDRRRQLLNACEFLTQQIVHCWHQDNLGKEIAVILYGSVARGIVRNPFVPNPSDIDLAVIGNFTEEESLNFREKITPYREKILQSLLKDCPNAPRECQTDLRYAGTMVQPVTKLAADKYSATLNYIASCARPLHDPENIWQQLKQSAIQSALYDHSKYKDLLKKNNN